MKLFKWLVLMLVVVIIANCARPLPPNGGPDDTTPPRLIKSESSANYQTNFKERTIELVFNEWVQLSNPIKEILISPPTEFFPEYKIKGKSVIVEFNKDEVLKDSVTYQINFGNAIKDFTAGNATQNLRFVFSTGDVIDSLKFTGKVIDSDSKKPLENIAVLLYDNLSDTVFTTERPFYFIYTNKEGIFTFENIKEDTFQIFALEDLNSDYFYSAPGEGIAFYDSIIIVNDSFSNEIQLELFKEELELDLVKTVKKQYGILKFGFNKNLQENYKIQSNINNYQEIVDDTIYFWYLNNLDLDSFEVIIPNLDTQNIHFPTKDTSVQKLKHDLKDLKAINPKDTIKLAFQWPILSINSDSIKWIDTTENKSWDTIFFDHRILNIVTPMSDDTHYELEFLPNAIENWLGHKNDSISLKIKTGKFEDFGSITVSVANTVDSVQYILELKKKDERIEKRTLIDTFTVFNEMPPGKYNVKLIEDTNLNGRWDTGNLSQKTNPERIFYLELEELKKSWDIESTITIEYLKNDPERK